VPLIAWWLSSSGRKGSAPRFSRLPLDCQLPHGAPSVAVRGVVPLTEGVIVENAQRRRADGPGCGLSPQVQLDDLLHLVAVEVGAATFGGSDRAMAATAFAGHFQDLGTAVLSGS